MKTIATTFCDFETLIKRGNCKTSRFADRVGTPCRPRRAHISQTKAALRSKVTRRPVTLVGIKFDPKVRNITIPKIEAL